MIISKVHRPKETIMVPKPGASVTEAIDFCTMFPASNMIIWSYTTVLGWSLVWPSISLILMCCEDHGII